MSWVAGVQYALAAAIGYVRESWWARNRVYIGCLVGAIGALAVVTVLVLGQTDIQVYGAPAGVLDCGTLFAPAATASCSGAHSDELRGVLLSGIVALAAVAGVATIVRTAKRRTKTR